MEHSSIVTLQKIRLLSAKKRCEIFGPLGQVATPVKRPLSTDFLSKADSPSAQNRNKKRGEGVALANTPSRSNMATRLFINFYGISN